MQNKANFRNDKMNINLDVTRNYDKKEERNHAKTKPIQTQLKPISMQNKPNSKPKQTQSMPIMPDPAQFSYWVSMCGLLFLADTIKENDSLGGLVIISAMVLLGAIALIGLEESIGTGSH